MTSRAVHDFSLLFGERSLGGAVVLVIIHHSRHPLLLLHGTDNYRVRSMLPCGIIISLLFVASFTIAVCCICLNRACCALLQASCVDLLLEKGADVDAHDGCAQTNALIEAVQSCTYVFPWSDKVRAHTEIRRDSAIESLGGRDCYGVVRSILALTTLVCGDADASISVGLSLVLNRSVHAGWSARRLCFAGSSPHSRT